MISYVSYTLKKIELWRKKYIFLENSNNLKNIANVALGTKQLHFVF